MLHLFGAETEKFTFSKVINTGNLTLAVNQQYKTCILVRLKIGIYPRTLMVLLTGLTKEPISLRVVNIIALMTEDLLLIVEIQNFQDQPHHGGLVVNRYFLFYNSVRQWDKSGSNLSCLYLPNP